MTHHEHFVTMGTVASITTNEPLPPSILDDVRAAFDLWERTFTTYAPSELGELNAGRLALEESSDLMQATMAQADYWRLVTDGAFNHVRPDGTIDLAGIVKALAIDAAGEILKPLDDYCLNVGGDVLTHGSSEAGPWVVGIVDPDDRLAMVSQFECSPFMPAIATSGTGERGAHIWGASPLRQVSVAASNIVEADVLATAIAAGGPDAIASLSTTWPIEMLAFGDGEEVWATEAFLATTR